MVDVSPATALPAGVLLQPMVVHGTAVDGHLTVLIQNESRRETFIPVGTVLGQLCHTDLCQQS